MAPLTLSLSGGTAAVPHAAPPRVDVERAWRGGAVGLAAVLAGAGLAAAVIATDVERVVSALLALVALTVMAVRPHWATLTVIGLLYLNVPVLLSRNFGVPKLASSAIVLLLAIPLLHQLVVRRAGLRVDGTLRLMLSYLVLLAVSAVGVPNLPLAGEYLLTYVVEGVVLCALVINVVRDMWTLRQVLWTLLLCGALLGAFTSWQEMTGSFRQQFGGLAQRNYEYLEMRELAAQYPEMRVELGTYSTGGRSRRAGGPVSEPNRFAQILIVLLPFGVWLHRTAATRPARVASAVSCVLVVAGLVFTDSRGGFVILLGLAAAAVRTGWTKPRHLLLALAVLVATLPLVAPRYVQRVSSLGAATALAHQPDGADGAIRGRATEMLAAGRAFLDHPLLGVGPGQYMLMYSAEYHMRSGGLKFRDLPGPRRAHSLYLELAAETGITGLAMFAAIVGLLIRALWNAHRRLGALDGAGRDLAMACVLSLAAYLGTAMFLHLSYVRYYWLLIGVGAAACHVLAARVPSTAAVPTATRPLLAATDVAGVRAGGGSRVWLDHARSLQKEPRWPRSR